MPHLIEPFRNQKISKVVEKLRDCHRFLVSRVVASATSAAERATWGITMKRMNVSLEEGGRPVYIGKSEERFSELVNMLATVERLIGTLTWLEASGAFPGALVRECHPTTSDEVGANDVVLANDEGRVVAQVEVCDVVSSKDGNRKAESCIEKLGCANEILTDGVRRFIGTSPELALRLASPRGRYRYVRHEAGDGSGTVVVELVSSAPPRLE